MFIVAVEKGILNSHKNINDSFSKNCKKVKQLIWKIFLLIVRPWHMKPKSLCCKVIIFKIDSALMILKLLWERDAYFCAGL